MWNGDYTLKNVKPMYNVFMENKHMYISFTKEEVDHIRHFIALHGDWRDRTINRLDDIFAYLNFPKDYIFTIEAYGTCVKETKLEQKQKLRIN